MADGDTPPTRRPFSIQEAISGGNPYPHYAWHRANDPVHTGERGWPVGQPQVVLFRHADVMEWLRDPRMIRQFNKLPEIQTLRKLMRWQPPAPDTFAAISRQYMLFQDPPEHTRLRTIATRAFTPQLVADQREEIERIVSGLLETFREEQGGEGDLLQALAWPLPMLVMARVLGIPHEDLHRFRAWSAVVGATVDALAESPATDQPHVDDATRELSDYLRSLVRKRRSELGEDLISRLIAAQDDDGGRLDEDELVAMSMLMITAGHETMTNIISNGTLALMQYRDQWNRLVADPSLAGNAAEELIRYDSPVQFTTRIAGETVEIDGVRVARGSEMVFMLASANRDETVWDDPDTVRIDRKFGRHMGFGMGVHYCMGVPLARLEAEITLRTLAREAPGLELTDPEPRWRPVLHGLHRLDVRLSPRRAALAAQRSGQPT